MSLLHQILDVLPTHWKFDNYENKRYILIDLQNPDNEYKTVKKMFTLKYKSEEGPIKIQRIQHAYAFAAYLATKDYLYKTGEYLNEKQLIINVCEACVNMFVEYNCDFRRKCVICKNGSKQVYVVIRSLQEISETEIKNTSSMYFYPEYIITFQTCDRLLNLLENMSIHS